MKNRLLENKVIILTRVLSIVDEIICRKLVYHGANILVCNSLNVDSKNKIHELAPNSGNVIYYEKDISIDENALECVQLSINTWGRLDMLIVNGVDKGNFFDTNEENLESTLSIMKFSIPELQKTKGCIVSSGSEEGKIGDRGNACNYAYTKIISEEICYDGIRANYICRDNIDLSLLQTQLNNLCIKNGKIFITATPGGRRGTPEEVANLYLWMMTDEASNISGMLYAFGWKSSRAQLY
jgi:NAD(P)-dependent dehydrogenase (short-subunit alcohol dehydrogenase family)